MERSKVKPLNPGNITLQQWRAIWQGMDAQMDVKCLKDVAAGAKTVDDIIQSGRTVYGINTGFGKLANVRIDDDDLSRLQRNLIESHACGTGPNLPNPVVRLMLALKLASLSQGASGIRPEVTNLLEGMLQAHIYPVIPAKGSVGASGDLAPLAHMALVLMGDGEVSVDGVQVSGRRALCDKGLDTIALGPKEGLALINGTQASTAIAMHALFLAERVFQSSLVAAAMSLEAIKGSHAPFMDEIHQLRRQPGQIAIAKTMRGLLDGSEIMRSHTNCAKVQDPYSFRCIPQVMGAVRDNLFHIAQTLELEGNAVTDNPLVLDEDTIVSGGNFHAAPVAFAADLMAMVLCEIGNMSERRTSVLVDPNMSGLPPFLAREAGLNSGFMIPQVTSAALCSENKQKAYPASVDTIPTSANQEDHVSMATHGAYRLLDMVGNAAMVVAVEFLAAAEGLEHQRPLTSSVPVESAHAAIRKHVAPLLSDRVMAPDMETVRRMVLRGDFVGFLRAQ